MNKPTKAIAALCLLNSASVYALGVGEIKTHSALNQLLNAQIPLVGSQKEDPSNIRIGIASREAFAKAGIDRPHYLTQLKFTPILGKNGEITVDVRSEATIKEPFVNFILEVEWPQGRTLKEFTILLDPPITMSDVRTTPIALPKTPKITPTAPTTTQAVANYVAPATQAAPPTEYGPTKSRDTVWGIAKKLMDTNHTATHQQMMLALYDNNPKAFYKKNMNALKKGAILQLPSDEQINSRSITQANNDYVEQNALWSSSTKASAPAAIAQVDKKAQPSTTESSLKKKLENNVDEAKLTLLTPKQEATLEIPVEGNTAETPVGSTNPNNQANIAIEMATTLEEENKEVKSRLNDLESQVDKLQRLLALKDEQLAQLQSIKPVAESTPDTKPPATNAATPVSGEDESNLPLYGGGLVIALLGLFLARRKKEASKQNNDDSFNETPPYTPTISEENIEQPSTSSTILEEEPLLSEFTPSEFNASVQTQEADPLTECDVYIAYGRYQQAEDLIKNALKGDADNLGYKLKLLDVYFSSANSDAFEELASSLSALKESDPDTWNNIAEMGSEINPDSTLFLSPLNEEIEIQPASNPEQESSHEDSTEEAQTTGNLTEDNTSSEFDFDFNLIKNEAPIQQETESSEDFDVSLDEIEIDAPSIDTSEDNFDAQFSLAQASIEMEDIESARHALNEILVSSDNDSEKQRAQDMLDRL
jgi:pilus assembly protein FimV